jgi:hypothetical protein
MSSAADTLRRAAEVLRERAEAATTGPWRDAWPDPGCAGPVVLDQLEAQVVQEWGAREKDAAYIATVDPTVGLLLAHLLDDIADLWGNGTALREQHALDIARAILRDQP